MKTLGKIILILILVPLFIFAMIALVPILFVLSRIYSLLTGKKWATGIKWYSSMARRDAVKEELRQQQESGAVDSVYDVNYDVLMSSQTKAGNDSKPAGGDAKPLA